ncbi:MAG TPA: hypothetical protein VMT89_07155 [Candidatus Acidoferrales bacterium]|nr:hypothetical protein [Candidatus Acidoferrales bacterium]
MANESPLLHDGSQCILGFDARNSTLSGTTLAGPSGSGQYLAVRLSTTVDRTVILASTVGTGVKPYGILQNKGSTGQVADVGIFGISKAVCGATSNITGGSLLMVTNSTAGTLIAFSSAADKYPIGIALETPTAAGAVFTVALYGFGAGSLA